MSVPHVEDASDTGEKASHGGVHEAGEKRHVPDAENVVLGISPRTNVGLEEFHESADDVKNQDDPCFQYRLHSKNEEQDLNYYCGEKEKVVPRYRGMGGPSPLGEQHETQYDSAEQTGPSLLEYEQRALPKQFFVPGRRHVALEPYADFMEPGFGEIKHEQKRDSGCLLYTS